MDGKDIPFDMAVVGATGDLGRRKLMPALYFLHKYGEISPEGRIFASSPTTTGGASPSALTSSP